MLSFRIAVSIILLWTTAGLNVLKVLEMARLNQPPAQEIAGLAELSPREAQIGSEIVLTLEGYGFFESGQFLGVAIGGVEAPVLDFVFESDNFGQVRIFVPEEVPPGEQPIAFFFEFSEFEAPFFVQAAEIPGQPLPGPQPPEPLCDATCITIVVVVSVLIGAGVVGIVRKKPGRKEPKEKDPDKRKGDPPPIPEDIDFNLEKDFGDQGVEPAGRPITPDLDLQIDTKTEHEDAGVEEGAPIVDEAGVQEAKGV